MRLSDFLVREAILVELKATTRDEALREIVRGFQDAGSLPGLDPDRLLAALLEREGLGSTAFGDHLAVPHAELPELTTVVGSIARAPQGVEYQSLDGKPVNLFFPLFFPIMAGRRISDHPKEPFLAFRVVARLTQDADLLARLRQCRTPQELFDTAIAADEQRPEILTPRD